MTHQCSLGAPSRLVYLAISLLLFGVGATAQDDLRFETLFEIEADGPYKFLNPPATNDSGAVAFLAQRFDNSMVVVRLAGGSLQEIHDTLGESTSIQEELQLANNGDILIDASSWTTEQVFLWDESQSALRLVADRSILSSYLGVSQASRIGPPDMNDSGQIAFKVYSSALGLLLVRWTDGVLETIAVTDGPGPSPWNDLGVPQIEEDGSLVAFVYDENLQRSITRFPAGGGAQHLVFGSPHDVYGVVAASGGHVMYWALNLTTDAYLLQQYRPGGGITTEGSFGCSEPYYNNVGIPPSFVSVNAQGDSVFYASTGACSSELDGLFHGASPVLDALVTEGDLLAGAQGPTTHSRLHTSRDSIDSAGNFVFTSYSEQYPTYANSNVSGARILRAVYEPLGHLDGVVRCAPSPGNCPCGNDPISVGTGCANSNGFNNNTGAYLEGFGSTSVANDDMEWQAGGLPHNKPALLFAGQPVASGQTLGDGLLCASGPIKRLAIQESNLAGMASWGRGILTLGDFSAGSQLSFQVWYRDPVDGPCASGFNLTNAFEVQLTP